MRLYARGACREFSFVCLAVAMAFTNEMARGVAAIDGAPPPEQESPARGAPEAAVDPVGTKLESFSFRTIEDASLSWDAATRTLRTADGSTQPRFLAIHVFQPDCNACQSQARALQRLHTKRKPGEMAVIGIAHRRDAAAAKEFARTLGVTYPIAVATGSDWAQQWGRGDPMYVVGADGKVAYSQEGFQPSDTPIWDAVWADLRESRAVAFKHPQRTGERLKVGDKLPSIELPDLMTGRPIALRIEDHRLTFIDPDGKPKQYRASVGFISRY